MHKNSTEGRYDLHTHSSFSDGTTLPEDIAKGVKEVGLQGFSLTDHDTIDGWQFAREAAFSNKIDFLPGMELTTEEKGRSIHLLAYGTLEDDERLLETLADLRDSRLRRSKKMILLLQEDFQLNWDAVLAPVETGKLKSIGRPHLADALVKAGYFANRSEVFADVLSPKSRYYVPTQYLSTIRAVKTVRAAGGFPVLAHPAAFRMRRPIETGLVELLAGEGLGGIELHHPENRPEWIPHLAAVAQKLALTVTGASDYHGAGKPNKIGQKSTPSKYVEKIRAEVATPN